MNARTTLSAQAQRKGIGMIEFLHGAWHVVWHSFLETVNLLPFLFLTYLLMEFLEHKSGDITQRLLRRSGKIGPLVGGALGIVPQCGFSAAASGLYGGRLITVGTLLAVYLSTSDEMLPIMITGGASVGFMLTVLACKLVIAVAAGFAVDGVLHLLTKEKPAEEPQIEELCQRDHCKCGDHFLMSALNHTVRTLLFIFLICVVLNGTVELIGEDTLAGWVLNRPFLGNLLAALVGLIPNCASSVILTELYLSNVISLGAMMSGLLVNAGVGLLVLFRNNRPVRNSLCIVGVLFLIGVVSGLLLDLTSLSALIGSL